MQCPSCQFENMPGSGRCARCSASLALATTAINVHPPRAGRMSRFAPTFWRTWHALERAGSTASPIIAAFAAPAHNVHFDLATLLRGIIPGWPQYYRGNKPRAYAFFFSYVALMLPAVVLAGTFFGSILLGLAVAMHVTSFCDAMVSVFASLTDRVLFTLLGGLVLSLAVYWPIGWLVSRVATPVRINRTIPPFHLGDVLWYSRGANAERGELVLYSLTTLRTAGRTAAGQAANYVFEGDWMGRVIATAGENISLKQGKWYLNGTVTELLPITPQIAEAAAAWTIPAGHALVFPEGLVPNGAQINIETLKSMYIVPLENIRGHVYFRSLPLSRMAILK